jgi:membrane protein YdbS with pleckstrin-like domain
MTEPEEPGASAGDPPAAAHDSALEGAGVPASAIGATQSEPSVADGVVHRLDPRDVQLRRLAGWILCATLSLPLLAVALGLVLGGRPPLPLVAAILALWLGLFAGLAWLAQYWPDIAHRHAAYKVDDAGIEIRRGVVWRSVVNVARSRIQHTDVSQGPLERRFGLAGLLIYTAGTDHAEVELRGLNHATALRIRDHLLAGGGDDAV